MTAPFTVTDTPDPADRAAILDPLLAFNASILGPHGTRPLAILIRGEDGAVIGGLWGRTGYAWLFVELLYVPEAMRGQGTGAQLLEAAETEARARGCHSAWLDTLNPQAVGFYEKAGYRPFGKLDDYPTGNTRYFFQKRL